VEPDNLAGNRKNKVGGVAPAGLFSWRRLAEQATSPIDKQAWLRLAEDWIKLAEETEKRRSAGGR